MAIWMGPQGQGQKQGTLKPLGGSHQGEQMAGCLRIAMILVLVMEAVQASAGTPSAPAPESVAAPTATNVGDAASAPNSRAELTSQLIERGRSHEDARAQISALTDEDVCVLSQNPGMLTPAGDQENIDAAIVIGIAAAIGIGAAFALAAMLAI